MTAFAIEEVVFDTAAPNELDLRGKVLVDPPIPLSIILHRDEVPGLRYVSMSVGELNAVVVLSDVEFDRLERKAILCAGSSHGAIGGELMSDSIHDGGVETFKGRESIEDLTFRFSFGRSSPTRE
jgi:hypothetical protein